MTIYRFCKEDFYALDEAFGFPPNNFNDEDLIIEVNETNTPPVYEMDENHKAYLRQCAIDQFNDPIKRQRHKDACDGHKGKLWINDGLINKRVTREAYEITYSAWNRGRLIPKENAFWNYDKTGENNPFFGKKHTKETLKQISRTKRGIHNAITTY